MREYKYEDLTGRKYGRLLVLRRCREMETSTVLLWECKCNCGNVMIARGLHLKDGRTKSCGCYRSEKARLKAASRRHGRKDDEA